MTTPDGPIEPIAPPLDEEARRRGRRIAISSHPLGMTFSLVFTQHLPTLALVSLGASEAMLGIQSGLGAMDLLRLPALRVVSVLSKRTILIAGQVVALLAAAPLLLFPMLLDQSLRGETERAVAVAMMSLVGVTAAVRVAETVWFPMLRSYVEAERIGRFFGALRSSWHLALIVYYLGASLWLRESPDSYGPLFAVAWGCGLLRILMIRRMPERNERTGQRIRAREAIALLRHEPRLRQYLLGVGFAASIRNSVITFLIVMMRREVGFTDAEVLYTTVASFAGGLASLYPWGLAVDRVGSAPVFRATALAGALLIGGLVFVDHATVPTLLGLIAFFFTFSILNAGFGVADTHVLFGLAPPDAPARTLVIAAVVTSLLASLSPLAVGAGLEWLLAGRETGRVVVYHGFFIGAAICYAMTFVPLRRFRS